MASAPGCSGWDSSEETVKVPRQWIERYKLQVYYDYTIHDWLVVWNINFIFPYLGLLIIPIDFHIFQRGGPTTNQMIYLICMYIYIYIWYVYVIFVMREIYIYIDRSASSLETLRNYQELSARVFYVIVCVLDFAREMLQNWTMWWGWLGHTACQWDVRALLSERHVHPNCVPASIPL